MKKSDIKRSCLYRVIRTKINVLWEFKEDTKFVWVGRIKEGVKKKLSRE